MRDSVPTCERAAAAHLVEEVHTVRHSRYRYLQSPPEHGSGVRGATVQVLYVSQSQWCTAWNNSVRVSIMEEFVGNASDAIARS